MQLNKALIESYLDFRNNYLSVETFAEHNQISIDLACLIIKEGRIHWTLSNDGFNGLDSHQQKYLEEKMCG